MQVGLLALLGIAVGSLLGAALPFVAAPLAEGRLPVPAVFGMIRARRWPRPGFYGLLTALAFTLWPLARARAIPAGGLFRDLAP